MSNTNNSSVPTLRFPEFEGEWDTQYVKDICDITTGKSNTQDQVDGGQYPFYIRSATPVRSNRYLYDCEAVITIGDGQIGKVFHYVNGKFDLHQRCYMMFNFRNVSPRYFYYFFSEHFYERAMRLTAKATVDSVRLEMISDMPICIPPTTAEQERIASSLSEIDALISAQEQKVGYLKEKKKGLIQQLFPLPGETTPRLRFPGFTGEWQEKPLSHFLHEHKTKSDGKCEVHSVSVTKGVINQIEYLGRSFAASDTSKYNLAKPGDIIYTKSPTGAFPYGIVKQNKNPYNVIVSPLYAAYTPVNQYVGYILDSYFESPVNTNNYLSSLIQKGAKNTIQISNDTFVSKTICLPSNPAEQQQIAECLESLDSLIAAEIQELESLKVHKKGLMQQLFPQPNK